MRVTIRQIGTSRGIIIPKTFLTRLGLEGRADIAIEGDALMIRRVAALPRVGWAAAAKAIAHADDDTLVLGEFTNQSADVNW